MTIAQWSAFCLSLWSPQGLCGFGLGLMTGGIAWLVFGPNN